MLAWDQTAGTNMMQGALVQVANLQRQQIASSSRCKQGSCIGWRSRCQQGKVTAS